MHENISALIDIECTSEREFGFDRIAMRIARFPEVMNVSVVSGRSDLTVLISTKDMKSLSYFVTEILAPMEGVKSTKTQIFMKTYKESGEMLIDDPKPSRLPVAA